MVQFSASDVNQFLFCIELKYVKLRVISSAFANSGQILYNFLMDVIIKRKTKNVPVLLKIDF